MMRAYRVPCVLLLVGVMAGLAPVHAARADAASLPSQGIRLVCQPAHVVLGGGGEVEVRVELPPEATRLELFASAGQVGSPTSVAPGVFRATYVPPRQSRPGEVILVARARGPRGDLEGWTVLPLWGQGEAEVRTRARAPVSLRVGEQTFGPIPADEKGLARVPITVPPGVRAAVFGSRRIELGLPPWPYVHAVPNRREVWADREETVEVWLHLSRLSGTPRRPPRAFSFSVSRGRVSAPVEREPGVFLVSWTVPPGPMGPLELRGVVGREPRWSLLVQVEARPGPAQHFEMRLDRDEFVASEEARVLVEVSARDAVGNPTRAGLRLASELSEELTLVEQRVGEYATRLTLPARFAGRESVELRLLREGSGEPVATRRLKLCAGELARVRMAPLRPVLVADGLSEAAWHISLEDRFGNPVVGSRPEASLTGGLEGTLQAKAPGQYELRYVPPESRMDQLSEVVVRAGGLIEHGTLPLLRRSVLSLAPRVGVMTNLADVRAGSVGLRVEAWPVRAWPSVGVWLDTGYLWFSRTGGTVVPGFSGENGILDTSLAVALRTPREYGIQAWAGAGVGVAWVRGRARWGEGLELEQSTLVLGGQVTLGAGARVGPGQPFAEVRFFRFNDPALPVLRGVLQGAGFHVGYRLELF
ncbi:hypothetical protein [Cystobacter fuscus]|nr:hypothetical protein [Cystobacter fuscus]